VETTDRNRLQVFGKAVRRLRLAVPISQEELADRADLHRNYVGGVERGERNVGLLNILKIAESLGVAPSTLFDDYPARQKGLARSARQSKGQT
jgi:transcriptional regulator with XRE-family HTH domain